MKKNKAINAATYAFQSGECVLVDANIWIYLQPPVSKPTPNYARQYSFERQWEERVGKR